MARTAFLASRGEHSVDQTPQLSRLLFLCLAITLEQGLSIVEAFRLLRPGRSPFRRDMLRAVESEFLRESLAWFDALKDSRQDELAASTLARLENFVTDPQIRSTLTETECCLDIHDVIRNHKKLVVDCNFYDPLVPDDARTMLRLVVNAILAHKFATPKEERSLTVLLLDEAPQYSTMDLAAALELGRELNLGVCLANQFPSQFKMSQEDTRIFDAVQHCARTRIVFGGIHVDQLEGMVKEMMIDQWDPMAIKHRTRTLIAEPTETTREVVSRGRSLGGSVGGTLGTSSATAHGASHGVSRQRGTSSAHSDAMALVRSNGTSSGMTDGQTILPNGEIISIASATGGASDITTAGMTSADSSAEFQSEGEQHTTTKSVTKGSQHSLGVSVNGSWSESRSVVPFHELRKHWQWENIYWRLDEFLTLCLQRFKALPKMHFVLKVPGDKAVFARAHFVRVPWISKALRTRALERIVRSLTPDNSVRPALSPAPPYQLPAAELESPGPAPENYPLGWGE
jgi:hypothetical protein